MGDSCMFDGCVIAMSAGNDSSSINKRGQRLKWNNVKSLGR